MAGPDNINGRTNGRMERIDFSDPVCISGKTVHIVLVIPEGAAKDHLSSLILFLDQLYTAAAAEYLSARITVRFLGPSGETEVELARMDEGSYQKIIEELIERRDGAGKPANEVSGFSWDPIINVFEKEDCRWADRITFFFQPEGMAVPAATEASEFIVVPLAGGSETYPFQFIRALPAQATERLSAHFRSVTACDAHTSFARALKPYVKEQGIPEARRIFFSTDPRQFLLQNAINALTDAERGVGHNPLLCSAETAFDTASETYFGQPNVIDPDLVTGREKGDDAEKVARTRLAGGLYLYPDGRDRLPRSDELIGSASSYWEILAETAARGDGRAKSSLIRHMLVLLSHLSLERVRAEDFKDGYVGPHMEKTFTYYLSVMDVTPSDLFEAAAGMEGDKNLLTSLLGMITRFEIDFRTLPQEAPDALPLMAGYENFSTDDFLKYIMPVLRPVIDNFFRMGPEEKKAELGRIKGFIRGAIPKMIITGNEASQISLFVALEMLAHTLAVGEDVFGDEADFRGIAEEIVGAVLSIRPEQLTATSSPGLLTAIYLVKSGLLGISDARRLIEWTFAIGRLHEDAFISGGLSRSVRDMWDHLGELLGEDDLDAIRPALTEVTGRILRDRLQWIAKYPEADDGRNSAFIFYWNTSIFLTAARFLHPEDIADVVAGLLDLPDPEGIGDKERRKGIVNSVIGEVHRRLSHDEWCIFIEHLLSVLGEGWKVVRKILRMSVEDDGPRDIITAVYNGLERAGGKTFGALDEDYMITVGLVDALYNDDIKNLMAIFHGFSPAKVYPYYPRHYLSEKGAKELITYILKGTLTFHDELDIKDINPIIVESSNQVGDLWQYYDDSIHGELWDRLFQKIRSPKDAGEIMPYINPVFDAFRHLPVARSREKIEEVIKMIGETDGERRDSLFHMVRSLFVAASYHPDLLLATLPMFDHIEAGIEDGILNPTDDRDFTRQFIMAWYFRFYELPSDAQLDAYIHLIGPLYPFVRALDPSGASFLTKFVIAKDGYRPADFMAALMVTPEQDREKAVELGRRIYQSRYMAMLGRVFDERALQDVGIEGIIEGFIEAAAGDTRKLDKTGEIIKRQNIRNFLETGFFTYYNLFSNEEGGVRPYYRFLRRLFKKDIPVDLLHIALDPVRNDFLAIASGGRITFGEGGRLEFFRDMILDKDIPLSTRRELWWCLKQVHATLSPDTADDFDEINRAYQEIEGKSPLNF